MKSKEEKTNAIRSLEQKKLQFQVHDYSQSDALSGLEVADYLGENPDRVFKTLVTVGRSAAHYVFLVPVSRELDLKKAAKAVNEKSIGSAAIDGLRPRRLLTRRHEKVLPDRHRRQRRSFRRNLFQRRQNRAAD